MVHTQNTVNNEHGNPSSPIFHSSLSSAMNSSSKLSDDVWTSGILLQLREHYYVPYEALVMISAAFDECRLRKSATIEVYEGCKRDNC